MSINDLSEPIFINESKVILDNVMYRIITEPLEPVTEILEPDSQNFQIPESQFFELQAEPSPLITNSDLDFFDHLATQISHPTLLVFSEDPDQQKLTEIEYRGFHIPLYSDDYGQQFYCICQNQVMGFGAFNTDYMSTIKEFIDYKLDTIYTFDFNPDFAGAKLSWLTNFNYKDIGLFYKGRLLTIFRPEDFKFNRDEIIPKMVIKILLIKSVEILQRIINNDNNY